MAATITGKLVSLAEVADAPAVSTQTVRRYIADGHLDAVPLGRTTLRITFGSTEVHRRPTGWRVAPDWAASRLRGQPLRTMHSRCTQMEKGL